MNEKIATKDNFHQQAERLTKMINMLTLFTRRTVLEWMPDIASSCGIKTEQFAIMLELKINPNQNLKNLSRSLIASASNVSVLIQAMVKDGLVIRVTDPEDRRRVLLKLSDQGYQLYSEIEKLIVNQYRNYLQSLAVVDQHDFDQGTKLMVLVLERLLKD